MPPRTVQPPRPTPPISPATSTGAVRHAGRRPARHAPGHRARAGPARLRPRVDDRPRRPAERVRDGARRGDDGAARRRPRGGEQQPRHARHRAGRAHRVPGGRAARRPARRGRRRGAPEQPHRGLPDRGHRAGRPAGRDRAGPRVPHRPPVGRERDPRDRLPGPDHARAARRRRRPRPARRLARRGAGGRRPSGRRVGRRPGRARGRRRAGRADHPGAVRRRRPRGAAARPGHRAGRADDRPRRHRHRRRLGQGAGAGDPRRGLRQPLRRRPSDGRHRALRARRHRSRACSPAPAGRSASTRAPTCTGGCGSPRSRWPWVPRSSR